MASKRISQETFDDAVQENVEEFCMEPDEALEDAIKQFESQGIDLSNIIKSVRLGGDGDGRERNMRSLLLWRSNDLLEEDGEESEVTECLNKFRAECDMDFSHRSLAATKQAYPMLYKLYVKFKDNPDVLYQVILSMAAFFNGQPDVIDQKGIELLYSLLKDHAESPKLSQVLIKTIRITCFMHENNRQAYVKEGLIASLIQVLQTHKKCSGVVKEACQGLRILTADDDVRVAFGHAHEHAKMIVEEGALKTLLGIMAEHTGDVATMSELCATLSRLAVRNEFCQEIVDLGGLKLVLQALVENMEQQVIVKQVFAVLKAIAGNDNVKVAIVEAGGISAMLNAMNLQQSQPQVCENGCAAMAAISLRNPGNCKVIMESGGAAVIIQVMKIHKDESKVQKQACMAVRSLVVRTKEYIEPFLELGAESLINQARARHHKMLDDEAKAALRDLGCKVELRELWKGEKTPMTLA
ncbi:LOW QUALITY PROTEIN: armadillo repeat-containing protein 6-like [Ptychodera flava]|uniref:LOW QUALITY PROTEIN: armadillo repeat-containing protein 6-like n=1 Tax=Ptychodera flava TaxID=63121 RepID=UPI00396AAB64